jgi:hypothetical protein
MASIHKSCGRDIPLAIHGYSLRERKGRRGVAGVRPVTRAADAKKIEGIDKLSSNRRGQSANWPLIGAQKSALSGSEGTFHSPSG